MQLVNTDIACICYYLYTFGNMYAAFLENTEIVYMSLIYCDADNVQRFGIYNQLGFQCVSLFLT